MKRIPLILGVSAAALVVLGVSEANAKKAGQKPLGAQQAQLSEEGKQLEIKYSAMLAELQKEISKTLPVVDGQKLSALVKAHQAVKAAEGKVESSGGASDRVKTLQTAMGFWKGGIRSCEQKLAKANAALKAATTDVQREAAKKDIDSITKSKEVLEKKMAGATAEIAKLEPQVADSAKEKDAAKGDLSKMMANEAAAARALLESVEPFLANDKMDAKLVKAAVLARATPAGLAQYASQNPEKAALVDQLLADDKLMREMVLNGGAMSGRYGQAMEIYTAIQKASPKAASEGMHQRLALGVALELARPIPQQPDNGLGGKGDDNFDSGDESKSKATVDPVKRYLSYEQAWSQGLLDPAFKTFAPWEYRLVVNSNASDNVLQWGRDVIRNYRPDYVTTKKNGWNYSSLVKSDVKYGSENCKFDRPELNNFQNILKDGGVCGRRAFFGRFILQANGIPVWGVTQHKHAALSRWSPKGWVVNLGAGFNHSWWDKGDVPMSGTDFLTDTQARRHPEDYLKVQRAKWISRMLGEEQYNGRKNVAGGTWSSIGHYLEISVASKEVELGPLGAELAEANAPESPDDVEQSEVSADDQKLEVGKEGQIIIPAVAVGNGKSTGGATPMKSIGLPGMQILGGTGFKADYGFEAPRAGRYVVSAKVVTVHDGHKMALAANGEKATELAVAYTGGLWQQTQPYEVTLKQGRNTLHFELTGGSKMAIKEFSVTPVK